MSDKVIMEGFVKLNVKYDSKSEVIRHIFMKEHKVRDTCESKPLGKTLFVINIPPFVDHNCLRHLFAKCGKVSRVWFHSKPTSAEPTASQYKYFDTNENEVINGYKVAYVVFNDESSVKRALKLADKSDAYCLKPDDYELLVGLKLYHHQYNKSIVDVVEMQEEINKFMTSYDRRVEQQMIEEKASEGIADADGWIKVTTKRKKPVLPNSEASDQIIADKRKKRKRKASSGLQHFYAFQARDSKIEHLMELRKKFEDDKKRIAIMKASRKFRPF